MARPMQFDVVKEEIHFDGFFQIKKFRLRHERFQGGMTPEMSRELFERGQAVAVLPYDPVRDEVVLIEQFRVGALKDPAGPWIQEIVAGMNDKEESPEAVAHREALEEIGRPVSDLIPVCECFVSPGGTSEKIAVFVGRVDAQGVAGVYGLDDEVEDIRAFAVPYAEIGEWLESGRVNSAVPIVALQWLLLNRARIRAEWGLAD